VSTETPTYSEEMETMRPAPDFSPAAYPDVVEALAGSGLTFRVWGGDWCPDCREQLPAFAAALAAAEVPPERVVTYPVERVDGEKEGPGMDEYGVEYIPTVIVERDGEEVARFVEDGPVGIAASLADQLSDE
jgi:thioredoxin 1